MFIWGAINCRTFSLNRILVKTSRENLSLCIMIIGLGEYLYIYIKIIGLGVIIESESVNGSQNPKQEEVIGY